MEYISVKKLFTRRFLLFLFLIIRFIPGFGNPEYTFENFTTAQGLSNNIVFCILQDHTGFLWFGTENGLNRYDGNRFKIFRNDPGDTNSLSDSDVRYLFEDSRQRLWIATTAGGVNVFDPDQEKFIRFMNSPDDSNSIIHNKIAAICEDRLGGFWIGTRSEGVDYLHPKTGKFSHFKKNLKRNFGMQSMHIWDLHIDRQNVLWIATEHAGLFQIDLNRVDLTSVFNPDTIPIHQYSFKPENAFSLNHNDVAQIIEAPDGTLWFAVRGGGVNYFEPRTGKFFSYTSKAGQKNSLSHNFVNRICLDHQGRLWAGTWGEGLNLAENRTNHFIHFKNNPEKSYSLSHDAITAIYEDKNGNIWIGTWGGGLNKINPFKHQFKIWRYYAENPNSLSHRIVQAIYEDNNGFLWVGTYNGINRIDRKQNKFQYFPIITGEKLDTNKNYIITICEEKNGQLWIGTGEGLYLFNPQNKSYQKLPGLLSQNLAGTTISAIYEEDSGDFWTGTHGEGLYCFNLKAGKFIHYLPEKHNSDKISSHTVNFIYKNRSNNLWIGTAKGINLFNASNNLFEQFYNESQPNASYLQNIFLVAHEDKKGRFWTGTQRGLFRMDIQTGIFYPTPIDDAIYGILEDENGYLWISTNQRLVRFDPAAGNIKKSYKIQSGLNFEKFHQNAFFRNTKTGELFFGGVNGMISFFPNQMQTNRRIPPIVITDFQIFNQSISIGTPFLNKSIINTEEITLSYKEKVISFEFAVLDFVDPSANQYAYYMKGFDEDWIMTENRNFATYTNLPPGDYEFSVKGANNDGVWNETGTTIRLKANPPFWETPFAYLIYLIVTGSIIYGWWRFYQYRTQLQYQFKMQQFEAERLKEVDRMKSRFFANISHEFRTPITLILGPLEKWIAKITDTEAQRDFSLMRRNVQRLHRLINQLLDLSRIEAGKMELHLSTEDLVRLVNHYVQSFESQAKLKEVQLLFEGHESRLLAQVDREKMENIIYNLISNALKFTPKNGKITVSLNSAAGLNAPPNAPSRIEIKVSDTGIGIPADRLDKIFDRFYQVDDSYVREHEGSGIGLALTKDLVELHGGEIVVNSAPGVGSVFTVLLPVGDVQEAAGAGEITADFAPTDADGSEPMLKNPESTAPKDNPLVLIVEDNADLRTYIGEILQSNYRLLEAADGVDGYFQAREKVPDLIISDVMMPKMDGFQLCAKLKTDEITSHIPIILLTARATKASKLEGLETGADDYLIKPFDAEELQVRIKNLITQRRQLRARFSQKLLVEPHEIAVTSADERFLERALNLIEENMANPEFNAEEFSRRIGLSRSQLHRKLDALTGQSTTEFIRAIRLKRAASLIKQGYGNISEIAFEVGFNHLSYFTECFRKEFGVNPKDFI